MSGARAGRGSGYNGVMVSVVIEQLQRFGPTRCETLDTEAARAWALELATSHYENFVVVSRLVPRHLREHFASVYAFCRWADDLGDETGDPQRSLELLSWWRDELDRCYAGDPRHPVFVALRPTIERFDIPPEPWQNLISAFEQDQRVHRYQTWPQVLDYCTRSADPVGRLVLYLAGHRDEHRQHLSDQTCTGLQLVNFWQDVRRDIIERDRIYVPADVLAAHGLTHDDLVDHVRGERQVDARPAIRELVDRTWPWFKRGRALWPRVGRDLRTPIRLFTLGGEYIMRSIERIDHRTLDVRPRLGRSAKARLMLRAFAAKLFRR